MILASTLGAPAILALNVCIKHKPITSISNFQIIDKKKKISHSYFNEDDCFSPTIKALSQLPTKLHI